MKLYEVLSLQEFYNTIKDKKLPIKTTYKLSKLMRRVEEESQFYSAEFAKIVNLYAKKENGELIYSQDGTSIEIIPGKENECSEKILELQNLEVNLSEFSFELEEFEGVDVTLSEMQGILPLIKD